MSSAALELQVERQVQAAAPGLLRRLLLRPLSAVCIAYLVLLAGIAIFAPIILPNVASENAGDLLAINQGPSLDHPLGTDTLGRDVLARLLVGTRVTLVGVVQALLVVLALGVPLGLAAGYFGGRTDQAVNWLADLKFSVPGILIILVVLTVFPQSMTAAMVTFGVLAAAALMRIVRSATLPVREELYIDAARVSGLSQTYIVGRHVLPRIVGPIIVTASLLAAAALLTQTSLAFLRLVVSAPAPSWGGMVADGASVIVLQSWLIWPPGIAITLTIVVLGLLGDAVRDASTEAWSKPASAGITRGARSSAPDARAQEAPEGLLTVDGLSISFVSQDGSTRVVEDVCFNIPRGTTVGLVGESGCGKTVTALSILGLLPETARVESGQIWFESRELLSDPRAVGAVRGGEIGFISQEPMVSLDPVFRVGTQITEAVRIHHRVSRAEARARTVDLLRRVRLSDPEIVARRYPHELSGGMAQRVSIARALAGEPKLLIADEPTTALDVTVQAEILELLRELQHEREMAVLLVTHDWGVVADSCSSAIVMYAGQVVERGPIRDVFASCLHPYTEALLAANPHYSLDSQQLPTIPGTVPKPGEWPAGCHFHPRCHYAMPDCQIEPVSLQEPRSGHETRCIHYRSLIHDE